MCVRTLNFLARVVAEPGRGLSRSFDCPRDRVFCCDCRHCRLSCSHQAAGLTSSELFLCALRFVGAVQDFMNPPIEDSIHELKMSWMRFGQEPVELGTRVQFSPAMSQDSRV